MQGRKEKEDYRRVAAVRIDLGEKEKRETEDSKRVKGPLGFDSYRLWLVYVFAVLGSEEKIKF